VHLAGSGRGGPVVDDTDDLIDGERDDAEHAFVPLFARGSLDYNFSLIR